MGSSSCPRDDSRMSETVAGLLGIVLGASVAGAFALGQDRLRAKRERDNQWQTVEREAALEAIALCQDILTLLITENARRRFELRHGRDWEELLDESIPQIADVEANVRRLITLSGLVFGLSQDERKRATTVISDLAVHAMQAPTFEESTGALDACLGEVAVYQRNLTAFVHWNLRSRRRARRPGEFKPTPASPL